VAGEETWFRVDPPGLALDAGRGPAELAGTDLVFLSHGHLDHALGLPYLLSQRHLHHRAPTTLLCPREIAGDVADFAAAAGRLERIEYRLEIVPLAPGERRELGGDLALEAFATDHVVPSLGLHLLRKRRSLRPELAGLPNDEIRRLRLAGEAVQAEREELWLSYCGDTGPGLWERAPRVAESRVLLLECTFVGATQLGKGAAYGHLHFDDLVRRADRLARHEAIVLHHLSRRHALAELRAEVDARLPELAARIHLWGEERSPDV
jgi:ribonuclease Z